MYVISRKVRGTEETLKDSNSNSNKIFHNFSSAEILVKKLNLHTHSDKKWCVKKIKNKIEQ
ncbi:hypothetical protein N783_02380 [Pontibacillus marinus BH030004 = DSM 16465]|uniref:Uncharacterized protein n=1 Tax=Pontibacillus marinus BH030004 = DSM 16465 TaxID=1385511 RepID=A0A0A5GG32_9BACI|nr:hypothetical protein N783_02380 [Pontibacillus marinus BH030004 = DSM 16465]